MDLSAYTCDSAVLAHLSSQSAAALAAAGQAACASAAQQASVAAVGKTPAVSSLASAAAASAAVHFLTTAALECARGNCGAQAAADALAEAGLATQAAAALGAALADGRDAVRAALLATLFHADRVVDVQWRLDYIVKSKHVERIDVPIYVVTLTTAGAEGKMDKVDFACTLEQMQDLVAKLHDAVKQPSRLFE